MPSIKLNKAHTKSLVEVRELAEKIAHKMESDYDVCCTWSGDDCVNFKRSGLTGCLIITGTCVDINLDLSFLLAGFTSKIEQRINEQLDQALS